MRDGSKSPSPLQLDFQGRVPQPEKGGRSAALFVSHTGPEDIQKISSKMPLSGSLDAQGGAWSVKRKKEYGVLLENGSTGF